MSDAEPTVNATFIPAPPGLTLTTRDTCLGTIDRYPVVAFRVDGDKLVPYAAYSDASIGACNDVGGRISADWIPETSVPDDAAEQEAIVAALNKAID